MAIWIFISIDGSTLIVTLEEAGDIEVPTNKRTQFYRNPAFFGVLIGVGALIVVVIVCLLLVAFRGGRIDLDKFHGNCACSLTDRFSRAQRLFHVYVFPANHRSCKVLNYI